MEQVEIYTVKSGESLSSIARDILGDLNEWKTLAYVNSISHPYIIRPGQILQMPRRDEVILEVVGEPVNRTAARESQARPQLKPATALVMLALAAIFLWPTKR